MLSEWIYNAFLHFEVMSIDRRYFGLRMPLERRLYELARKHLGNKMIWTADIVALQQKCGSKQSLTHYRAEIRKIIQRDLLPDYHMGLDTSVKPHRIVFYTRDEQSLLEELAEKGEMEWFAALEKRGMES